jgi:hypothetical protein
MGHRDNRMGRLVYRHAVKPVDVAVKPMEEMFGSE